MGSLKKVSRHLDGEGCALFDNPSLFPLLRSIFRDLFQMALYDSESSGGEDNDYTETNVLLGYASKEASDDTVSHLGGRPVGSRFLQDSSMP